MHPSSPGITFREGMTGWFHLGSVEPGDGERQGQAARTRLSLEVSVTIADVRAFMRDPAQAGTLHAQIAFEPLGRALASTAGAFQLLTVPEGGDGRLVRYEAAFDARGSRYYLACRRELRGERRAELWSGITTMHATLHEGRDAQAPIVGAGILRGNADGVQRLVDSVRVTGADSLGESSLTLAGFGRYFLGDLWEEHAAPRRGGGWRRAARRLLGRGR